MKLIFNSRSGYEKENEVSPTEYGRSRTGFWAYVTAVHSDSLTVDLENFNGFKFHYVPVASREWVSKDGGKGERNLPPVGSRVFVMMPTGTIQGGFVLCSGFSFNSVKEQGDFRAAKDENIEKFNSSKKILSNSGWAYEENLENGNISLVSGTREIKIEAANADDNETSLTKGLKITAFGSSFSFDDDGFMFAEKNDNKITFDKNGAVVADKNGNKITMGSGGISIEDRNGNKIETSSASVKINGNLEVLK